MANFDKISGSPWGSKEWTGEPVWPDAMCGRHKAHTSSHFNLVHAPDLLHSTSTQLKSTIIAESAASQLPARWLHATIKQENVKTKRFTSESEKEF